MEIVVFLAGTSFHTGSSSRTRTSRSWSVLLRDSWSWGKTARPKRISMRSSTCAPRHGRGSTRSSSTCSAASRFTRSYLQTLLTKRSRSSAFKSRAACPLVEIHRGISYFYTAALGICNPPRNHVWERPQVFLLGLKNTTGTSLPVVSGA